MSHTPIEPIVQFARVLHGNHDPVLQYLPWEQVDGWLRCGAWEKLRFLLRKLPLAIIPDRPEFFYVRGHALWGQNHLEEARNLFEKARYFYRINRDDPLLSALSCIEIADIAHSRRQYQEAEQYLQAADTLLASAPATNPYIAARYGIVRAVVLYERGPLSEAIQQAQAAYTLYETLKDAPSQLFCLISIASAATRMGDLEMATSQTAVARSLFATSAIPALYYVRILNAEVHIAWHRGDLTQAMMWAERQRDYASQHDIPHYRLYAAVLLGHLQRGLGDLAAAAGHYADATAIAESIGYLTYLPELALHQAWLHVLAGELEEGRELLQRSTDQMEVAQWMGANVVLAVIGLLAGAGAGNSADTGSEELLTAALIYHTEIEAAAVVCAVHCYLALSAFRRGWMAQGQEYGNAALRWLNEHNLDYFPHWWHPALLAEFAAYALEHCTPYAHVLHRLCVHHLGDAALGPLTGLLLSNELAVRLRAQQVLDAIQQTSFTDLDFVRDPHTRAVLMQLLAEHKLRRAGLPLLFTYLTTAEHQRTPNATLVAVFGLYLAGLPRAAIAAQLQCSKQLVRNYIGEIYGRFGVIQAAWPERRTRFEELRALAREAGFV